MEPGTYGDTTRGGEWMKLHWKVAIALVIGALLVSQVLTFRALAAMDENMEGAHTALQAAMEKANKSYQDMASHWSKMNGISGMSAMDKDMVKLMGQSAAMQKAMMDASNSAIKAIEGVWKHEAGKGK